MPALRSLVAGLVLCVMVAVGGCPEDIEINFPDFSRGDVEVEIINDTAFAVAPNIVFDDDSGFFASLAPADVLSTGLIQPGELAVFRFDCDELGLILSDNAEQVAEEFGTYVAEDTDTLEREEEFDCGDVVRFRFVGELADFGVIVSVNGRIVD